MIRAWQITRQIGDRYRVCWYSQGACVFARVAHDPIRGVCWCVPTNTDDLCVSFLEYLVCVGDSLISNSWRKNMTVTPPWCQMSDKGATLSRGAK